MPALVQKMPWCRPGGKPLSEPMLTSSPTHAALWGDELNLSMMGINKLSLQLNIAFLCILMSNICGHLEMLTVNFIVK